MKKNKKKIQCFKNVVVFPGTVERLIEQAQKHVEKNEFEKANEFFSEALRYTEGDELTLSVYAYSLYEAKSFEKAKEVCEKLLSMGPSMYLEVMELYLTICMQLKQYKQVETIISSLLEEGAIPDYQIEKFERLKNLNASIANRKDDFQEESFSEKNIDNELFQVDYFLSLSPHEQLFHIHELTEANIRPIVRQLIEILEHSQAHPFVKSLLLILMVEQQIDAKITIRKFQRSIEVNPSTLLLPTKLPQYQRIRSFIIENLEQEPSKLEMVEYLISKHAIGLYPFEWLDFNPEDVAFAYIDFVSFMFGNKKEIDSELINFIQELEKLTELQEV